jgi:hypothetical protein
MNLDKATEKVETYLSEASEEMNKSGSALPGYVNRNLQLKISDIETYEFGWVFYYDCGPFVDIGGNAPLIVDKNTGELFETGTAFEMSYYINNFRKTGDPHCEE